jgi:hypothetical protein
VPGRQASSARRTDPATGGWVASFSGGIESIGAASRGRRSTRSILLSIADASQTQCAPAPPILVSANLAGNTKKTNHEDTTTRRGEKEQETKPLMNANGR